MANHTKKFNFSITTSADYQPVPNVHPVPHAWTGRSEFLNPRDRTLYDVKPPVHDNSRTHTSHVLIGNWVEDRVNRQAFLDGLSCTEMGKDIDLNTVQRTSYKGQAATEKHDKDVQILNKADSQRSTLNGFKTPRDLSHQKKPHGYEEHNPYQTSTQVAYSPKEFLPPVTGFSRSNNFTQSLVKNPSLHRKTGALV